ncbi:hypothetical protein [Alkalibacter mobilis]|uniref:hypothetical protein n=1 Tax=Alkalibacter mobilis TaxID=2787712 RepID=UPI00189E1F4E|nr:hypothetical protein [Alkalibacter mobilis]MBF7096907.1 hypothetical protein [Alkalibacter mobilis]
MNQINFQQPYLLYEKCECQMQLPVDKMKVKKEKDGYLLSYKTTCPSCGTEYDKAFHITENPLDFSDHVNAFKVLPALKDELAVVKLDSLKGKIKDGELFFYGNYKHLRFFDNKIQDDVIVIDYSKS